MIKIEKVTGEPIQQGKMTITPVALKLTVHAPKALRHFGGGVIWNRPSALLVEEEKGESQRLPVHDVTTLAILGFIGVAVSALLVWFFIKTK